jgi:hypothetical protein
VSTHPEESSGGVGSANKATVSCFLLVEAANIAVRFDPELRKEYLHRCQGGDGS